MRGSPRENFHNYGKMIFAIQLLRRDIIKVNIWNTAIGIFFPTNIKVNTTFI